MDAPPKQVPREDLIDEVDANGNSPLHLALQTNTDSDVARTVWDLTQRGCSVFLQNKLGLTPVHIAAANGHAAALKVILSVEADAVDVMSAARETPLFWAVQGGHEPCVRTLLHWGAKRDVKNARGQSPTDVASTDALRAIMKGDADSGLTEDALLDGLEFLPAEFKQHLQKACASGALGGKWGQVIKRHGRGTSLDIDHLGERENLRRCASKDFPSSKSELCRYYRMAGGCVRGDACMFLHDRSAAERELGPPGLSSKLRKANLSAPSMANRHTAEELGKKCFIGGIPPSVDSDELREFFQDRYGTVVDAVVISSQNGASQQSRGFGFVTFKCQNSADEAVRDHYVVLQGKKVEVKSAIPRPQMAASDYAHSDMGGAALSFKRALELSCTRDGGGVRSSSTSASPLTSPPAGAPRDGFPAASGDGSAPVEKPDDAVPVYTGPPPPWLIKFREWLPVFLSEVSQRLKDGEHYPLSSLKGDFRATCGQDMDHVAIGFPKLSDFIRSVEDLVRMKIMPVGVGPATHMILLPRGPPKAEAKRPVIHSSTRCPGVSYAAAANGVKPPEKAASTAPESNDEARANTESSDLSPRPPAPIAPAPPQFEDPTSAHRRSTSLPAFTPDFAPGVQGTGNSLYSFEGLHAGSEIVSVAHAQSPWNLPEYKADMLRDAPTFGGSSGFNRLNLGKPGCGLLGSMNSLVPLTLGPELQMPAAGKPTFLDPRLAPPQTAPRGLEGGPTQDPGVTAGLGQFQGSGAAHVLSMMGLQQHQNPSQELWGPLRRGPDLHLQHLHPLPEAQEHFLRSDEYGALMADPHAAHGPAAMLSHDSDGMCALCSERRALWTSLPCQHRALCTVCKERLQVISISDKVKCICCHASVERWIAR